jgi:glycosyltransferase involved in cell wall biosynthesis
VSAVDPSFPAVTVAGAPSAAPLRVLGVSIPDVSDWVDPIPSGKWSRFFAALARRFDLIDVLRPELSSRDLYLNRARAFHPRWSRWRARAGFNQTLFMKRTEAVQRGLQRYQGSYDLIIQLQTLSAPGFDRAGTPYAIYTDNTMALTRRFYPAGARLSPDAAVQWMRLEADVCRSASAVFCFSEFARRSMIDDYGCYPDRVVAVGAGANQALGSLGGKDYAAPRALFVGVDFTRKGGDVLLDAWPIVREHVAADLILAGPRRDPRSADLPGVSWVGRVDRDALAALYRSASVFVLPSLFEPWGHVFLEAMGHGLPCVGTSCCAMPEIIDDGVTGRLVPPGEAEPLAAALIELLTDPTKTATMGHAAHAKILHGNSWSDVVDRLATHLSAGTALT